MFLNGRSLDKLDLARWLFEAFSLILYEETLNTLEQTKKQPRNNNKESTKQKQQLRPSDSASWQSSTKTQNTLFLELPTQYDSSLSDPPISKQGNPTSHFSAFDRKTKHDELNQILLGVKPDMVDTWRYF